MTDSHDAIIVGRTSAGPIVILATDVNGDTVQVPLSLERARFLRDRLTEYLDQSRTSRSKELPLRRGSRRKATP